MNLKQILWSNMKERKKDQNKYKRTKAKRK